MEGIFVPSRGFDQDIQTIPMPQEKLTAWHLEETLLSMYRQLWLANCWQGVIEAHKKKSKIWRQMPWKGVKNNAQRKRSIR
jgi:hypothetical protein